jgi:hypothetical protein
MLGVKDKTTILKGTAILRERRHSPLFGVSVVPQVLLAPESHLMKLWRREETRLTDPGSLIEAKPRSW